MNIRTKFLRRYIISGATKNVFTYYNVDDYLSTQSYIREASTAVVPSQFESKQVKQIGPDTFSNNEVIQDVTISVGIETIL